MRLVSPCKDFLILNAGVEHAKTFCSERRVFRVNSPLQAYSAREDLITQTKVSEQVRDFLLKKTERLKHQVCSAYNIRCCTNNCLRFMFGNRICFRHLRRNSSVTRQWKSTALSALLDKIPRSRPLCPSEYTCSKNR